MENNVNEIVQTETQIKKKKNFLPIIIVAVVLIIVGVVVYFSFFSEAAVRDREIKNLLASAEKYLDDLDYEKALAEYEAILKLDPTSEDALEGYVNTASAWAEKVAEDDPEEAIDILEDAIKFLEKISDDNKDIENKIEKLQDKIDDYNALIVTETVPDETDDVVEDVVDEIPNEEVVTEGILVDIAAACSAGDYDTASSLMWSDDYLDIAYELADGSNGDRMIIMTEYGKIGAYNADGHAYNVPIGDTFIYYGDYAGDIREGEGVWINTDDNMYLCYVGEWSDDMPNGEQHRTRVITNDTDWANAGDIAYADFTVVNGLFEGVVSYTNPDGSSYEETFEMGVSLDNPPEDDGNYTLIGSPWTLIDPDYFYFEGEDEPYVQVIDNETGDEVIILASRYEEEKNWYLYRDESDGTYFETEYMIGGNTSLGGVLGFLD